MKKGFSRLFQILLAVWLLVSSLDALKAQQPTWIEFSSSDGYFSVSMPEAPKEEVVNAVHRDLHVSGTWYTSTQRNVLHAVWSLSDLNNQQPNDPNTYLDAAADLLWYELLKHARQKVSDLSDRPSGMAYTKELTAKSLPGREYSVSFGDLSGTAQVYVSQQRIFILLAADTPQAPAERERFFASFKTVSQTMSILWLPEAKSKKGEAEDRVFANNEVDQKARIISKSEPSYTESARVFGITGTIVLRAVFSKTGTVSDIQVVKRLPHGLTERCVEAARVIQFVPAQKDGMPVSTSLQLEYNFNLY
jgi:TonB family protein